MHMGFPVCDERLNSLTEKAWPLDPYAERNDEHVAPGQPPLPTCLNMSTSILHYAKLHGPQP